MIIRNHLSTYLQILRAISILIVTGIIGSVFVVSKAFVEPTTIAKYFYLCIAIPIATVLTFPILLTTRSIRFTLTDLLVGIYLVYFSINYFTHESIVLNELISIFLMITLYFIIRIISSFWTTIVDWSILIILLSGIGEAIWGLLQIYGWIDSYNSNFALTGSFFNPAPYSGYLTIVLCIALAYIAQTYRRNSSFTLMLGNAKGKISFPIILFYCALFVVGTSLLVLPVTMSRSAWMAIFVITILICIIEFDLIREIKIIYIGNKAITVVAMITTIAILTIVALSLYNLKKESADARIFNWKITGKVIADNPVNGVGIGFFGGNYGEKQANYYNYSTLLPQDINIFDCPPYAFNEYLHITAEQGVIGLTLILVILFTAIKKTRSHYHVLQYGLFALIIFAFTSYPFHILSILTILFLSLGLITNNEYLKITSHKTGETVFFLILMFLLIINSIIFAVIPNHITAHKTYKQARSLYNKGLYEPAVVEFSSIFTYLQQNKMYLFEYGHALNKIGKYELSNKFYSSERL